MNGPAPVQDPFVSESSTRRCHGAIASILPQARNFPKSSPPLRKGEAYLNFPQKMQGVMTRSANQTLGLNSYRTRSKSGIDCTRCHPLTSLVTDLEVNGETRSHGPPSEQNADSELAVSVVHLNTNISYLGCDRHVTKNARRLLTTDLWEWDCEGSISLGLNGQRL